MNPDRRHYPKAPILEAVIDIKVNMPDTGVVIFPFQSNDLISDQYPKNETLYSYASNIKIDKSEMQVHTTGDAKPLGIRLTSVDKKRILQARLDGFTFSVLAPYDRWETFRDEARKLWIQYKSIRKHDHVTRIAVRYINQITIPCDIDHMNEYLTIYPDVPRGLPHRQMKHFFMQFMIPQEDLQCMLLINQTPTKSASSQDTAILLDIDVYKEGLQEANDSLVWDTLEALHEREYSVFESCITPAMRDLIC